MLVGVTGTRSGMDQHQAAEVARFLVQAQGTELHHGDCVGVDAEVAQLARALGYRIVCHPPEKSDLRAFEPYDIMHEPDSYFARNRRIVDTCDVILVVPWQHAPQKQGGTWYTHDYAIKSNKPVVIIYPGKNQGEQHEIG